MNIRPYRSMLPLRSALLGATFLGGASCLASPAAAQTEEARQEAEIVVTGSRLQRPDLSSSSPLTVVGEADLQMSGKPTLDQTLNQLPQLARGNTANVGNGGGAGILTANLRALGANRTLVLVNGRRFASAGGDGLVDLATIPDALVKRVEIITGGASAVYGSDAVAGVVNFVLKDDVQGFSGSYQYGQTTRADGQNHKVDLTFGTSFAENRGNLAISGSYTRKYAVRASNRDFSNMVYNNVGGKLAYSGQANVPGTRIGLSAAQLASLKGVNLTPTGTCSAVTGIFFGENGVPQPFCQPENTFNFAPYSNLERPLHRWQVGASASYDLTDGIEVFGEAFNINSRNIFEFSPDSFVPTTPGAASQTLLVPNYATSASLSAAVRQFFINNAALFDPQNTGTARVVGAGRSAAEMGPRVYDYESNSFSFTSGFRGQFHVMGGDWHWEAFYQNQRNRTDATTLNTISQTRLGLGLDTIVDATGKIVCRTQILGCVPVSIFGLNSITPEAAAFIAPPRTSQESFTRQVAGASLSGVAFALPAGPVSVAIGAEYRKEAYDFRPSPMDLAGEYAGASQGAIGGDTSVSEVFGELRIPLLKDLPFVHSLAIEGAARYSDYARSGGATTWKIAAEYAPVSWVRLRSAYNKAIRAPSLSELYSPLSQGFNTGSDPCAVAQKPTAAQKQLCVAQGVPAGEIDTFTQAILGFQSRGGGNPNLQPEASKTFTVGAVISPPFANRLHLTVDYFKVEVKDGIATVNAAQTLQDCFSNLDPQSATCSAIHRLSNGQLDYISVQSSNLAAIKVRGIDAQADYRFGLPSALALADGSADLTLQATASWLFERSQQVLATLPAVDCAGLFGTGCTGTGTQGVPDFKLNLNATYESGPLTFRAEGRMIGAFDIVPGQAWPVTHVGNYWYLDLSAKVRLLDQVELFGGMTNVLDRQPPLLGNAVAGEANTSLGLWDVAGRRFFLGGRFRF